MNKKDSVEAIKVLLVDDNPEDIKLIRDILSEAIGVHFDIMCAHRLSELLEQLAIKPIDLLLLDLALPDSHGLETLSSVQTQSHEIPIIILSDRDDPVLALEAIRRGAQDFLIKKRIESSLLLYIIYFAIDQKKKKEAALASKTLLKETRKEHEKLNLIFDSMIDGIYVISKNRRIKFMNKAQRDRFGDHIGDICYQIFHDREKPCPLCKISEVMSQKTVQWEWHSPKTDRTYDLTETPVYEADGTISKLTVFKDITRHRKAQKRLEKEHQRAEFYIDLMGHDINNINQITMGYLDLLLLMPDFPDKFRKKTTIALNHVKKSAEIISNVKILSNINSDELSLSKMDIYPALINAIEVAKSDSRDVKVNTNITKGKYFIQGNSLMFGLFSNLLNNAVKFDEHEIVEIDVDISLSDDDQYWKLEFKDRGRGISDENKKIIFNRLEQAGESGQGYGLGLTIVKYLVKSYHGNVRVEDRIGGDRLKGSNFIVMLPVKN